MQFDSLENLTSRKRLRPSSRDSDSGESSPKRAVSEGPSLNSEVGFRSPGSVEPQPFSGLSIKEDAENVDTYLNTQERILPTWSKYSGSKISIYDKLATTPLQLGQTWYMVSSEWLKNWRMACRGQGDKAGLRSEATLGPVDNSPLIDEEGRLRLRLLDTQDYEVVPRPLWEFLEAWYGPASCVLERKVAARPSASAELFVECYVPRLKVYRLHAGNGISITGHGGPYMIEISLSVPAREFLAELTRLFDTPASDLRCWRVTGTGEIEEGSEYPVGRLQKNEGEVLEISETDGYNTLNDLMVDESDEFAVDIKQNGRWLVESRGLPSSANGIISDNVSASPTVPHPPETLHSSGIFSSKGGFFEDLSKRLGYSVSSTYGSSSILQPAANITTGSKPPQNGRTPGTLGLTNLGNTCFMNSALQCLAHNEELTEYFLTELYREELNRENPLGMGGAIAESFGSLLSKIWTPSAGPTAYAPREFKQQLQRFAPQFSGYQQHDSQELVAFLLDGLHEDLNRVRKKPYVENPDWEGGGDKELVALAQKSWEGYISRNDSVIVDLFQGQYKSTLVCPECQKVSITFDPFMYLTLPLPIKKKWRHEVYFIPWDIKKLQLKIPVEVDNDTSFRELRRLLGRWTQSNSDNLIILEIFSSRIYKYLDDNVPVSDMNSSDYIVCYELPCKPNMSEKHQSTQGNKTVFPVYCATAKSRTSFTSSELFGHPFFIALTDEETRNPDAVYAAVVERLSRWTTNAKSLYKYVGVDPLSEPQVIPVMKEEEGASITEIRENGDVIVTRDADEVDIADVRAVELVEEDMDSDMVEVESEPTKIGPQSDMFTLQLTHFPSLRSSIESATWSMRPPLSFEDRQKHSDGPVVIPGDILYCKWEENMQTFFFSEHALWDKKHFEEFIHPELEAQRKQHGDKKLNGISIEDCLDEFTKEEQLGEEDPWYCPRCKKHQQATKNLQLWKVPDLLVVHLKRFSNSRILRDKLDAFVDFPLTGLDLENRVGEKQSAKKLATQGLDLSEFGLGDIDEPLLYDLFAVDEHLGGLGGGHYRAYTRNHVDDEWYHFDDSHVSKCQATDAINRNAYLLFYRRRTSRPIGGKTHTKIQAATQSSSRKPLLPTPPDETVLLPASEPFNGLYSNAWRTRTQLDPMSSSSSSPAVFEDDGPPGLESECDHDYTMLYPAGAVSPASISSNKADGGSDSDGDSFDTTESKGRLKPASFGPTPHDHSEPSPWEENAYMNQELHLSRAMSETEDTTEVISPCLLDTNWEGAPPSARLTTRQLPSPGPEESPS